MALRQIIDSIIAPIVGGISSDDTKLRPRLIYELMLPVRSSLLTNKLNKKQKLSEWTYQLLPCVDIEQVDASVCPCAPPSGCIVGRSKTKIPQPLTGLSFQALEVYTLDLSSKFQYTSQRGLSLSKGNKYAKKDSVKYMVVNNYLYFYGPYIPKAVAVKIILNNPIEALPFLDNCDSLGGNSCVSPLDMDFPLDPDLVRVMTDLVSEKLKIGYNQAYNDNQHSQQQRHDRDTQ